MKLHINGTAYPCKGRPHFTDPVRFTLPGDKPDTAMLGDMLTLTDDDGIVLRDVDISGITLRRYLDGNMLICTNAPEPQVVEPDTTPTEADDTNAMLVDHEYRLTLLELGVAE